MQIALLDWQVVLLDLEDGLAGARVAAVKMTRSDSQKRKAGARVVPDLEERTAVEVTLDSSSWAAPPASEK